ncbi:hypothetical protein [Streptomyces sp. WM6372]|nr:hypothetical protein [Streptomyces sp. WM6372]
MHELLIGAEPPSVGQLADAESVVRLAAVMLARTGDQDDDAADGDHRT